MSEQIYEKKDHHQLLTDKLVKKLEESELSGWKKPWLSVNAMPQNIDSGNRYRGINAVALLLAGFDDHRFGTLPQWNAYAKRKGVTLDFSNLKGNGIAVFKAMDRTFKDKKDDDSEDVVLKTYKKLVYAGTVFNASLIQGVEPCIKPVIDFSPHDEAELLRQAWENNGLKVTHDGAGRAFYKPLSHSVHMPKPEHFHTIEDYYATLMHEFVHASGSKLERDMTGRMGSAAYAKEELVAEIGSLFLGVDLGIPYRPEIHENHAAYCKSWLSALKGDKEYIFKASSQASRSVDYQLGILHALKLERGLIKVVDQLQDQRNLAPAPKKVLEMAL